MNGLAPPQARRRPALFPLVLAALVLLSCTGAPAQQNEATTVQVYWKESATVSLPGLSAAVALDHDICQVQVKDDHLQLVGLARGETVVFAWAGSQRTTLRVQVLERPALAARPVLSKAQLDALGHGSFSSSVLKTGAPGGGTSFLFQQQVDWTQRAGDRTLSFRVQTQSSTLGEAPRFNLTAGSIQYATQRWSAVLLDFLFMPGGAQASITPMPAFNPLPLRGAKVALTRGRNRIEAFAGATIPVYYLTLSGTRSITGFTVARSQSDRLYLYSTAGLVSVPLFFPTAGHTRQSGLFIANGFSFRWTPQWAVQGMAGFSNRGTIAQGGMSYVGQNLSLYANGGTAAADFPLSQMQVLFAGGRSVNAGGSYRLSQGVVFGAYFQHSTTAASVALPSASSGTYFNPNVAVRLSHSQQLTLNYVFSGTHQGTQAMRGGRFSALLNSTSLRRLANTAEFTYDTMHDPAELRSEAHLSIRDVLTLPLRFGSLSVGAEHVRSDPSTAARLASQLQLLTPQLREQFLLDPAAFASSPNLPTEIRLLVNNLQPSNTEAFVSAQIRVGRRLSLSPSFHFHHDSGLALGQLHNSANVGYSLVYKLKSGLQIQSTLSSAVGFDTRHGSLGRTSVFTIGIRKSLTGAPPIFAVASPARPIRGRVCVDTGVQGRCRPSDPGLAGIKVHLDLERSTITDRQGRFVFTRMSAGEHHVWLELSQFTTPIRVTTTTDVTVDTIGGVAPEVSFGIVNFARLMGTVFNDYVLGGVRQPDAPGMKGIRLHLNGMGRSETLQTDGSGDFELDDVPPGHYQFEIDRSTIPVNYVADIATVPVEVAPTSTVVRDIGLRALRSVSGYVYLRRERKVTPAAHHPGQKTSAPNPAEGSPPEYVLEPMPGIQVRIGDKQAETNEQGLFLIRDLPAGDLLMTLVARAPLPPGAHLPSGTFRMPKEPTQVRDIKVVVTNAALAASLVEQPKAVPGKSSGEQQTGSPPPLEQ